MFDIFSYAFMVRAFEVGLMIGVICPLIGVFLVLRRFSLLADTLSHVSLAGVAIGVVAGLNPILMAIVATVASSFFIEKLRKNVYGESALALVLSASLAFAVVLIGLGKGMNVDLLSFLFGSILAVRTEDVITVLILGITVVGAVIVFYKELLYTSFDEESAKVSGIPVKFINFLLIFLAAITIALAMRIVGVLLISALIVIPVLTALQLQKSFVKSIFLSEGISLLAVFAGIVLSYYLNLATGASIVLVAFLQFVLVLLLKR